MSDFIPKAGAVKTSGLGPKAQKLAAMREKAAQAKSGAKPGATTASAVKTSSLAGHKKTAFNRKAV